MKISPLLLVKAVGAFLAVRKQWWVPPIVVTVLGWVIAGLTWGTDL